MRAQAPAVVFVAAHLGFPMDRTPLGGGAMVSQRLARLWAREGRRVHLLGAGPDAPAPGLPYERLPESDESPEDLVSLGELRYAAFCRRFEASATRWILQRRAELSPESTTVLVNDISEGPDLAALARAGYPLVSIWHVDVVDYFNKLYLRRLLAPERLARGFERLRRSPAAGAVPDLLKLVFEKQRETVRLSRRLIFPSSAMAETVLRCYGGAVAPADELRARSRVVPWGAFEEDVDAAKAEAEAAALRRHYAIGPSTRVVLTVSRVSPEKGLHLLLGACERLERRGALKEDLCVLIGGQAAFMMGERYMARVRRAAARLSKARVFFPGYLSAQDKAAFYRLADLFVSPSVHESYGLNIAEALAAGLPVLASDHYGVAELVRPAWGRSVSYARDPEGALAEGLKDLLSDKGRLGEMGKAALAASRAMSFRKAADSVLEACTEIIPAAEAAGT